MEARYGEILEWAGRMSLERIAQTDAFYHTVEHTVMVTLVGQEILRGKYMRDGGVTPGDWLKESTLLGSCFGFTRLSVRQPLAFGSLDGAGGALTGDIPSEDWLARRPGAAVGR